MTAKARGGSRPLLWWDLGVATLLFVLCLLALFSAQDHAPNWAPDASVGARHALTLLPLAAFAALYAALGRRMLRRAILGEPISSDGPLFLALLVAVLAWAVFTEPLNALLQALAYPMVWTVVHGYRGAVLWSAIMALGVSIAMFAGIAVVSPGSGLLSALFTGPLSFVFAVVMGTWMTRIYSQGERYRELSETLRASQEEVSALSEAAGAAAERERFSRELHDTLTQTLTGLVMLGEQADRALAAGQIERARERMARVQAASREAVEEARALVATTQPLGNGGLEQAIERVATGLSEDTGLRVHCDLQHVPLDRERQVVLLRAAQEGLANARKHARAGAVEVTLAGLPGGGALLTLEDDGVGPDATSAGAGGFGLSGMVERVRAVGGTVAFGEARGSASGARLEVRLPVPAIPEGLPESAPRSRRSA